MLDTYFFEQQDGSRIAYKILESRKLEDLKNEPPLVLIMGLWATKELFMGLEEELAKHRKVILFDNRGMGESSVLNANDPISIDLMAQDTIALVKHLGIKRFNLLGYSMGGSIALSVALNVPSDLKLEKLILCAWHYNLAEFDYPKSVQEQKDMLMKIFEKGAADYMLEHPDKFDKFVEIAFKIRRPHEIFKRQWEAIKHMDFVSRFQAIKVPTLIIHGEDDEIIPIQQSELLAREIPKNKFLRIPNVGHSSEGGRIVRDSGRVSNLKYNNKSLKTIKRKKFLEG
ncbi:9309_t:CDS:2 [Ambispora leptoticha]|uniref:9309_t:CDS:1 n=1 Tax=Ambispora leptoticha TaxID=144679 RepID=A0A9N8Z5S0_9GLOM|nr:9309_t:CDS:2 [Ambispora leptoticha]